MLPTQPLRPSAQLAIDPALPSPGTVYHEAS